MARFHEITLEMVRPGPPHNQLLSPLTPYLALCGDGSPSTFHVRIEHHKLLGQLEGLRYGTPPRVREATLVDIGRDVEEVLRQIPGLLAEAARMRGLMECDGQGRHDQLVHLRLVLGGSELALLPFEMALAPSAMPGEGRELFLQGTLPVVVTREVRHSRPRNVSWNVPDGPRVLLVGCRAAGEIPLEAHRRVLVRALTPWVARRTRDGGLDTRPWDERLRERLHVLPNARLSEIYAACAQEHFTHVHVLSHGGPTPDGAGERRYAIALAPDGGPNAYDLVDGPALAKALHAEGHDGARRSWPLVVTLLTCDSARTGSVLVPGGSVAHELHVAGVPWVFGSQLPLTVDGSVRLAEALCPRLLQGDDPRQVLYEVRRQLHLRGHDDHDWASLVAYASAAPDFDEQVADFHAELARKQLEDTLARAESSHATAQERQAARVRAQAVLDGWRAHLPAEGDPRADSVAWQWRRVECLGMHGSVSKRLGLLAPSQEEARAHLLDALCWSEQALGLRGARSSPRFAWVATQVLSIKAVLDAPLETTLFALATALAELDLAHIDKEERAWAHGSLAELELLRLPRGSQADIAQARQNVVEHCRAIVSLTSSRSFQVQSTRRQFERYATHWARFRPECLPLARAALEALIDDPATLDGRRATRAARRSADAPAANRGARKPGDARAGGQAAHARQRKAAARKR